MAKFSTSLVFPDINVWVALASKRHIHHAIARQWFAALSADFHLGFCRYTQLGLLRLLTTQAVMGADVCTQVQAWAAYDALLGSGAVAELQEPDDLEKIFRSHAQRTTASPKDWADSYLAAFSEACSVRLVTFDQVLSRRAKGAIMLQA